MFLQRIGIVGFGNTNLHCCCVYVRLALQRQYCPCIVLSTSNNSPDGKLRVGLDWDFGPFQEGRHPQAVFGVVLESMISILASFERALNNVNMSIVIEIKPY